MGAVDRKPDLIDTAIDRIVDLVASGRREDARGLLIELLEDAEDAAVADERTRVGAPVIGLEQMKRDLGLDD